MSWLGSKPSEPAPAPIDILVDALGNELLLTCPSCGAQHVMTGMRALGELMALITDHIRTHTSTAVWTWDRPKVVAP